MSRARSSVFRAAPPLVWSAPRAPGMVTFLDWRPFSIAAATVRNGKIVELDFLAGPERIAQLDLTVLRD